MSCLNIKPSGNNVSPKFHIEKVQNAAGEAQHFFRDHFRVYNVVRGYITVSAESGKRIRLGCGDIVILPPGLPYGVRINTESTDFYAFSFSIDFVEHILQHQAGTGGVLSSLFNKGEPVVLAPVPVDMQIHLQHLLEFMHYEYDFGGDEAELALRNCLATVFCVFLELLRAQKHDEVPIKKNSILYAIQYVKTNFGQKLCSEDVARLIHMPKKTFASAFKQFSGHAFCDFLNKTRIEHAVSVLKKTEGQISFTELADLCGYENYITFYRNFVKYTGTSPAEFVETRPLH